MNQQQTIREMGLKAYLDKTVDIHNNNDYAEIVRLFDANVNNANIAKIFKVDWRTIKSWKVIWVEEES